MIKHFCDRCEKELTPEDQTPFIRQMEDVVVSLMVTNEHLHAINDICNSCKIEIVTHGKPYQRSDTPSVPEIGVFKPPALPKFPEASFEPSVSPATPQPT
jgi:hypothetical protein